MKTKSELPFKITKQGSLGLLAYGDIGLRAWRDVKKELELNKKNDQKK